MARKCLSLLKKRSTRYPATWVPSLCEPIHNAQATVGFPTCFGLFCNREGVQESQVNRPIHSRGTNRQQLRWRASIGRARGEVKTIPSASEQLRTPPWRDEC